MFFMHKILFSMILILGSMISISSNSWMGMWLGLEINLLAFIPMIQEKNNSFTSESSLKYFLTQALASIILLFSLIFMAKNMLMMKNIDNSILMIMNSSLLTKLGMAPFHFWFPEVIEGLNWLNCLILLTWQKITPMILVMYNFKLQNYFFIVIITCMLISGINGFNQISLRKILAYSSINHMAWMISSMFFSETIWFFYFLTYSMISLNIIVMFKILNIYFFNQIFISMNKNYTWKFIFSLNFLSLGGMPPFLGFLPKWLTIQFLMDNHKFLTFIMIMTTLMTLFFYSRMIFNIFTLIINEINYFMNFNLKIFFIVSLNLFSLSSLVLFSLSYSFT
uniref:NADH-ubiquinone oxidoreductase chain 2 n=1 Tax=Staphylinidae sp. BMNH 1274206 TaxID=1796557 RepID=A0A140EGR1_9COLE|nr:NADH dehydrogenase subunit 2 [Staphylinidae sp. BMNH 1274206]